MLRRTLLTSAGVMALTGAALAADLPSRAPPPVYLPPPPVFTWTGLYIGINAGGTWSNNNTVNTTAVPVFAAATFAPELALSSALATTSVPVSNSGFIGGGQIGYNYQFANSFVAGIEADIQGVASNNRAGTVFSSGVPVGLPAETINSTVSASKRIDYIGTVRGRLGFTITPTLLVYGTGGLAYGGLKSSVAIFQQNLEVPTTNFSTPFSSFGSLSNSRVGWTAGGGLEWLFAPNWSLKAEYLYYDLGTATFALSPLTNTFTNGGVAYSSAPFAKARFTGNIVRGGLNYHFNLWGPAPVVAKY
jgi:outer membrane immunogenic protein